MKPQRKVITLMHLGKHITFDVFYKNQQLIVIMPMYTNIYPNPGKLHLFVNGTNITECKTIIKRDYEPIIVRKFTVLINHANDSDSDIKITYESNCYSLLTQDLILPETAAYDISLTTLFKDDYCLIPMFCEYYLKKGVEHFFLYYNGIAPTNIIQLCDKNYITLFDWNFPYNIACGKYKTHAQIGQIHHALHSSNTNYMMFCDLDEYVSVNLKDVVRDNETKNVFAFRNRWCTTINNTLPMTFPDTFRAHINIFTYPNRSKCMYKVSAVETIGIHYPMCDVQVDMVGIIYHFYSWSKPQRTISGPYIVTHVQT